jgi:hypothetical protein
LVYKQNEQTLGQIGTEKLETMLRLPDWTDEKVDRRAMEALRIAQDYQQTGELKAEDTSMHMTLRQQPTKWTKTKSKRAT